MINQEVPFTIGHLEKLLKSVSDDVVLVGGQALNFWANFYDIDNSLVGIDEYLTKDADFLGQRKDVKEIAKNTSGRASYPHERAMTILAGQITIPLDGKSFLNVDVIHHIGGLDTEAVKTRALKCVLGKAAFRVMHPLDVLKSRIENLSTIKAKQTPEGVAQAKLSLLVANEFISTLTKETNGQKLALKGIEYIASVAKSSAGCKSSREFGIDFFQAIPVEAITIDLFHQIRWTRLVAELKNSAGITDSDSLKETEKIVKDVNSKPADDTCPSCQSIPCICPKG